MLLNHFLRMSDTTALSTFTILCLYRAQENGQGPSSLDRLHCSRLWRQL